MVKNKNLALIIGIVLVVLIIGGVVYFNDSKKEEEVIKVGVLYASTGPAAVYGSISIKAVKDAARYFEETEGIKVNLIFEDTQGNANQAVSGARKLLSIDRVKYGITGTTLVTQAVAPIFEQEKALLITDAAGWGITNNRTYLFQNLVPSLNNIARDINEIKNIKRVAIIYVNDDFGSIWSKKISQDLRDKSFELFSFERTTTDFKTDALKVKKFAPDVIVVIGYPPAIIQVLTDIELQNIESQKIIYLACTMPGVVSNAKYNLTGSFSYEYPQIPQSKIINWFNKNNISEQEYSNAFYALAFENTLIILNVAKEAGDNVELGKDLIKKKTFEGLYGEIRFDGKNYFGRDLDKSIIINEKCVR